MTQESTTTAVVLGPELSIAFAATIQETLLSTLNATGGDLAVDLSGVTDFDSSAVQLLLATRRSLQERGHALHIAGSSAAVRDGLKVFGLGELLAPAALT